MKQSIINQTELWVQSIFAKDSSGHDWWHIYRVRKKALYLAKTENADLFITEMASLLHDMADWKFKNEEKATAEIKEFLMNQKVDALSIHHIMDIIAKVSFKGAGVENEIDTLEGKCVQDADRLDAMGAIGIGRTFAYGGSKGRLMWEPSLKPVMHKTFEEYKSSNSNTINHFYEKLLLLKDKMNTATARTMAQKKHDFMQLFLDHFMDEWEE